MRAWAILGAIVACFHVIYVVGLYLVSGSGKFDRAGVTLPSLVIAYLASRTIGGASSDCFGRSRVRSAVFWLSRS
jgi:type IV secretory pathway VirB2 component (pilin)